MGPISGTPVDLNLILAADNPVAVDSVGVQIMGFEPREIEHLMLAQALGIGSTADTDIEVLGESIEAVRRPFLRCPTELDGVYPGIEILERTACSGCTGSIAVALERMRQAGELDEVHRRFGKLTLVVGRDARPEGEGRWVLVGRCQRKHRDSGRYVPGCPPQGFIIRDVLRMQIDLPPMFATPDWFDHEEEVVAGQAEGE